MFPDAMRILPLHGATLKRRATVALPLPSEGRWQMPNRLTDRTLQALKPAKAGQRYDVMDAVRGFGVRVTDKGQRTFILIARYPGSTNPTRRAIGEYPTLTLEKAREKARAWHKLLAEGVDPRVEQLRVKEDEKRKAQEAVAAVENRFERARGSTSAAIAKITGK